MRHALAAAALATTLALPVAAARGDVQVTSTFGFDGAYVPGQVTPIVLEFASTEKQPVRCLVTLSPAADFDPGVGGGRVVSTAEVFLAPGARRRVVIPVTPRGSWGMEEWSLVVETDRRVIVRQGMAFSEGRQFRTRVGSPDGETSPVTWPVGGRNPTLGVLGIPVTRLESLGAPNAAGVSRTRAPGPAAPMEAPRRPSLLPVVAARAPVPWICYEGLDALLWVEPDPAGLPEDGALEAVLEYAAYGGRLVVAATRGARVPVDSPLGQALPCRILAHDVVPLAELAAALAPGGAVRLGEPAASSLARLDAGDARVIAALPDGRPLAVERPYGMGSVVVLAFDPVPLAAVEPSDEVVAAVRLLLLGEAAEREAVAMDVAPSANAESLVNHMRRGFIRTPPVWLLVISLLVYVAVIGPGDYFFLKRRNALRKTVITFPLIVVFFTLIAYGASFLLFGRSAGRTRVAWIDLATAPSGEADVVRAVDLFGTYSPIGSTLRPDYPAARVVTDGQWFASGEYLTSSLRGAGVDGVARLNADGRVTLTADVPLRSQRSVQARLSTELPATLDAALVRAADGSAVCRLRNHFPEPIRDLLLVLPGGILAIGDLPAGAEREVPVPRSLRGARSAAVSPFVAGLGLVDPLGGGGLLSLVEPRQWRGTIPADEFVPSSARPGERKAVRDRVAKAALGATFFAFTGVSGGGDIDGPGGGGGVSHIARAMARCGVDLSRALREDRPVLLGWCEKDPTGLLARPGEFESEVVVVRRILPPVEGR